MTLLCLIIGCHWSCHRSVELGGQPIDCECCQRCGALRYHAGAVARH